MILLYFLKFPFIKIILYWVNNHGIIVLLLNKNKPLCIFRNLDEYDYLWIRSPSEIDIKKEEKWKRFIDVMWWKISEKKKNTVTK